MGTRIITLLACAVMAQEVVGEFLLKFDTGEWFYHGSSYNAFDEIYKHRKNIIKIVFVGSWSWQRHQHKTINCLYYPKLTDIEFRLEVDERAGAVSILNSHHKNINIRYIELEHEYIEFGTTTNVEKLGYFIKVYQCRHLNDREYLGTKPFIVLCANFDRIEASNNLVDWVEITDHLPNKNGWWTYAKRHNLFFRIKPNNEPAND